MALSLQIIKPDLSTYSYWRINTIQYNTIDNRITLIIGLYKDYEARLANINFFESFEFVFNDGEHPFSLEQDPTLQSIKTELYRLIKQQKIRKYNQVIDFNQATDLI